jgi:hypothetical protein
MKWSGAEDEFLNTLPGILGVFDRGHV